MSIVQTGTDYGGISLTYVKSRRVLSAFAWLGNVGVCASEERPLADWLAELDVTPADLRAILRQWKGPSK